MDGWGDEGKNRLGGVDDGMNGWVGDEMDGWAMKGWNGWGGR